MRSLGWKIIIGSISFVLIIGLSVGKSRAQTCSGTTTFTAASGTFGDGSGTANYSNNLRCDWLISIAGAGAIELSFNRFATEPLFDTVKIYEGKNRNGKLLATLSGYNLPPIIRVRGENAFVTFSTDPTITETGWEISYTSLAKLCGTYTIGGLSPDFNNFSDALTELTARGISCPVLFNVRDGAYTEQLIIPEVLGSGPGNTITIRSQSLDNTKVQIDYPGVLLGDATVSLDGADYIRLEHLSIASPNGRGIYLNGSANGNTIEECKLILQNRISDSDLFCGIYSENTLDQNLSIKSCELSGGTYGIYLKGNSTWSETGLLIEDCQINSSHRGGIKLDYQLDPILSKNRVDLSGDAEKGCVGIELYKCRGNSSAGGLVSNNFVHLGGNKRSTGILLHSSSFQDIVYNNINLTNSNAQSIAMHLRDTGLTQNRILNSNFYNAGGGFAVAASPMKMAIMDHNNISSTGPNLAYFNLQIIPNLSQWKLMSGYDAMSISFDPQYVSSTDLHVNQTALNGAGTPLPSVLDDIDGDPRNLLSPDIGADEIAVANLQISCPSNKVLNTSPGRCDRLVTGLSANVQNGSGSETITNSYNNSSLADDVYLVGTTMVQYLVVDGTNRDSCTFVVEILDNESPAITCPDNIDIQTDLTSCSSLHTFTSAIVADNCPGVQLNLLSGLGSGSLFPKGATTNIYEAQDASGNKSQCSMTVTVSDNEIPAITCPPNMSFQTEPGRCSSVVTYGMPLISDNCPGTQVTRTSGSPSGSSFGVGVNNQAYSLIDAEGNMNSCSFSISIHDQELPVLTCPPNLTIPTGQGDCSATYNYASPSALDNCSGVQTIMVSGLGSGMSFPIGSTFTTFMSTDASGNTVDCSFSLVVQDIELPSISCPPSIQTGNDPGSCSKSISYGISATDNCPAFSIRQTQGLPSGSSFKLGSSILRFDITDQSGNINSCSFSISVMDLESPQITCPNDLSLTTDPMQCDALVTFVQPLFSDNCPGPRLVQSSGPGNGTRLSSGSVAIAYTVQDSAGLMANCSFNVMVSDLEPPSLSCPSSTSLPTEPGQCTAVFNYAVSSADNCPGVLSSLLRGLATGSAFPVGLTNVQYEAVDANQNKTLCSFDVSVVDLEKPVINCPNNIVVTALAGQSSAIVSYATPTFSDNCTLSGSPLRNGLSSGSSFPAGVNNVSFTLVDDAGNISTCGFTVTVNTVKVLGINCPQNRTINNDPGLCQAQVAGLSAIPVNAGPGAIISNSFNGTNLADDNYPVGLNNVTYTISDGGQSASCGFEVDVIDAESPSISCPASLTFGTDQGVCTKTVNYAAARSADNCPGVQTNLIFGLLSGSSFPEGSNLVQYEAEDASGNRLRCSFVIEVQDNSPPSIICPPSQTLYLPSSTCNVFANYSSPSASDNCGLANLIRTNGLGSGNIFPVGQTIERYLVTDLNGLTADCSFSISVFDTISPGINCGSLIRVNTKAGLCGVNVNYPIPTVLDNCPNANLVLVSGIGNGNFFPLGRSQEMYKAIDASGNESVCSLDIEVVDQELPQIICPSNIIASNDLNLCGASLNYASPGVSDNCPGVRLIPTGAKGSGAFFPVGVTAEQYVAEDASGNRVTCSFNIIVNDRQAPLLVCPQNIVVNNTPGQNSAVVTYSSPTFSDNCNLQQSPVFSGIGSGGSFPIGSSVEQFRLTDNSGNLSTCSFSITVVFGNVLGIACPSDLQISTDLGRCDAMVSNLNPSVINASGSSVISNSYNGNMSANDIYLPGQTNVIYTVTDGAFMATCSFNITVADQEAPGITCPQDILRSADPGKCDAFVNYSVPSVSDNCVGTILKQLNGNGPGSIFSVGSITERFEVEDQVGNKSVCSFKVEVFDSQVPTINCPQNIIVNNDPGKNSAIVTYNLPTASDNCPNAGAPTVSGLGSGATFPLGNSVESYTITDASGNVGTCSFTVKVILGNVLSINCPQNRNVSNDPGRCDAQISGLGASVLNASTNAMVSNSFNNSPLADGRYGVGRTVVLYTVTDNAFTATCDFTIQVDDAENPLITCPASRTVFNDRGKTTAVVNYGSPSISDNCPNPQLSLISGLVSGSAFPIGSSRVSFQIKDASNNISACSFNIRVVDTTQAPNLTTQGTPSLNINLSILSLSTTVVNDGKLNASSSNFGLFLSTDTILDGSDVRIQSLSLTSLSPGNTSLVNLSVDVDTLALSIVPGSYYVAYLIDADSTVLEGNELDNSWLFASAAQKILVSRRNIEILGTSETLTGQSIKETDYTVNIAGAITTYKSGMDGRYRFVIPYGSSPQITPIKQNDSLITNGIDVMDAALISDHIIARKALNGPYRRISADVNASGLISVLDVNLIQALILGRIASFPGNKLWTFVPDDYTFTNPNRPQNYDTSRVYTNLQVSKYSEDYIGLKLGDVNDSRNPAFRIMALSDSLNLNAQNEDFLPGQEKEIDFLVGNAGQLRAGQFEVSYDPMAFDFITLSSSVVSIDYHLVSPGRLRVLWILTNPQSIPDGSSLFKMRLRAVGNPGDYSHLKIENGFVPVRIYKQSQEQMALNTETVTLNIKSATSIQSITKQDKLQVFPNPSEGDFILILTRQKKGKAEISIRDQLGRAVVYKRFDLEAGKNTIHAAQFANETLSAGSYLLIVREEGKDVRSKLIIH